MGTICVEQSPASRTWCHTHVMADNPTRWLNGWTVGHGTVATIIFSSLTSVREWTHCGDCERVLLQLEADFCAPTTNASFQQAVQARQLGIEVEGVESHSRAAPGWRRSSLAAQIKDFRQRNTGEAE